MRVGHISDIHLAKRTPGDDTGAVRLQSFRSALRLLTEKNLAAIVIAGDVFDRPDPPDAVISEAASCIAAAGQKVPVVLIPGNHDSSENTALWDAFEKACGHAPNVHLARKAERFELHDGRLIVDAYPCEVRFSPDPPWAQMLPKPAKSTSSCRHIAVAHGTLAGGPVPEGEQQTYPFKAEDVATLGVDYLALGHFHGVYPNPFPGNFSYSGAHEPDQFSGESGHVLIVDLSGKTAQVERLRTAVRTWQVVDVSTAGDVQKVESLHKTISAAPNPALFVVRIAIKGADLEPGAASRLDGLVQRIGALGAYVDRKGDVRVGMDVSEMDLESMPDGAVKQAMLSLHEELASADAERREILTAALQIGWELSKGGAK